MVNQKLLIGIMQNVASVIISNMVSGGCTPDSVIEYYTKTYGLTQKQFFQIERNIQTALRSHTNISWSDNKIFNEQTK